LCSPAPDFKFRHYAGTIPDFTGLRKLVSTAVLDNATITEVRNSPEYDGKEGFMWDVVLKRCAEVEPGAPCKLAKIDR